MSEYGKEKNIENIGEADKRAQAGSEAASMYGSSAKEHAGEALQQSKEALSGKQMQMSGGLEKQTEGMKASSKQGASSLGQTLSHFAESAKSFLHPSSGSASSTSSSFSTPAALASGYQAGCAKTKAESVVEDSAQKIIDEAHKAQQGLHDLSSAACQEKKAAQSSISSLLGSVSKDVKDIVGGGASAESVASKMNLPQQSEIAGEPALAGHTERMREIDSSKPSSDY